MLPVTEIFYSLQGEGFYTGHAAVFIRLAGCHNACRWCDAKETWAAGDAPRLPVEQIVAQACRYPCRTAIVTGGEPLLHPLDTLCACLREAGFRLHLETSGVAPFSGSWDWVCLSPKQQCPPPAEAYQRADELKVIVETPADFAWAESTAAQVNQGCLLFLQPEWNRAPAVTQEIIHYIMQRPKWRLSLQTHKFLQIP